MFAGRATNKWTLCDVCGRTMQLADIFVNVPDQHGTATVVCLACTHDISNAVQELFRSEDTNLNS